MPYGCSQTDWNNTKQHAKVLLGGRARSSQTISYGDLGAMLRPIRFQARDAAFHVLLAEVSTEEDQEGRGMLSVLVVRKGGDMRPGKGFYDLAISLGRYVDDEEEFWVKEFDRVVTAWAGKGVSLPVMTRDADIFRGGRIFRVRGDEPEGRG